MENKINTRSKTAEIDVIQLFKELLQKAWIIVLAAILTATAAFCGTYFFVKPKYEASIKLYVNNTSISVGSVGVSISSSDITAAQKLVSTYIEILKTRNTLNDVISEAGIDMTYEQLSGRISAAAVNSTEIFRVTVWDYDPYQAETIANMIARILPDKIASIVEGSSVKIVDPAIVPIHRSSPSYSQNTMLGFIIGAVVAAAFIILKKFSDPYIKSEDYITQTFNIPLLAVIPKADSGSDSYGKYGKYGRYGKTQKHKQPGQRYIDD